MRIWNQTIPAATESAERLGEAKPQKRSRNANTYNQDSEADHPADDTRHHQRAEAPGVYTQQQKHESIINA